MTDFRINVVIDPAQARTGARRVRGEIEGIETAADRLRSSLTRALGVLGGGAAIGLAIRNTIQFQGAIAELSTLIDTAVFDVDALTDAVLRQSAAFGQDAVAQAGAAYQIISAGASSATEAIDLLDASNRLAVAGVTDVTVAADGLTSVLNAYGDAVESAADVSDILFIGVRAGKTTVDELASSIGRVAPLAANAGVGFDELIASTAALTKGGISTAEAVTGLRAILAAVLKPSQEAADAAEALGIQFDAAALQSQGLEGFLANLVEQTGGSSDALSILFGGVEALVPVLALAGQAGVDFTNILEDMEDRAGTTQEAFDKIANSPGFQIDRLLSAIRVEAIRLLETLTQALVPAIRFLADNVENISRTLQALAITFALIAGPAAIGAFIGALATAANGVVQLGVLIATNPFGAIAVGVATAIGFLAVFGRELRVATDGLATVGDFGRATFEILGEAISGVINFFSQNFPSIAEITSSVFGDVEVTFQGIVTFAAGVVDSLIGLFVGGAAAIVAAFRSIPGLIEAVFVNVFNAISQRFANFLNGIIDGINSIGGLVGLGTLSRVEATVLSASTSVGDAGANVAAAFAEGFSSSTAVTDSVNLVFDRAEQIAQNRAEELAFSQNVLPLETPNLPGVDDPSIPGTPDLSALDNLGGGGGGAASGTEKVNEALERQKDLLDEIKGPMQELQLRQADLQLLYDQGAISLDEFTRAMRDLNVEVSALDNSFSGGLQNGFDRIIQRSNDLGKQVSDFVVGAFDKLTDSIVNFAKTGEFNVRQFFASLAEEMLRIVTNQLFSQLLGGLLSGGFGGFGGLGGGLLSSLGSLFGFQNGGSFTVGGSGGTDSQLVAFRATPGESVDVRTPGQVAAGMRGGGGGGETNVQTTTNVAAVLSTQDVASALDTSEGETTIINVLQRNSSTVQQIARG